MSDRGRSTFRLDGDRRRYRRRRRHLLVFIECDHDGLVRRTGARRAVSGDVPRLDVVLERVDVGQRGGDVDGVVARHDLRGGHLDGDVVAGAQPLLAHGEDGSEDSVRVDRVGRDGQRLATNAGSDELMRELRRFAVVGDLRLGRRCRCGGRGGLLLAAALLRRLLLAALFLLLRGLRWRARTGVRLRWRCRVGLGHRAGADAEARGGDDKQLAKVHSVSPRSSVDLTADPGTVNQSTSRLRCCKAGRSRRTCDSRAGCMGATAIPSCSPPASASTSPQGSTMQACPQANRFSFAGPMRPTCAGASTYAWFSMARARSRTSQCAFPVYAVNAAGTQSRSAPIWRYSSGKRRS